MFCYYSQIPARTSSAPPNIDEQKRDQVCILLSAPSPSLLYVQQYRYKFAAAVA